MSAITLEMPTYSPDATSDPKLTFSEGMSQVLIRLQRHSIDLAQVAVDASLLACQSSSETPGMNSTH
jgi:hypothetical protein